MLKSQQNIPRVIFYANYSYAPLLKNNFLLYLGQYYTTLHTQGIQIYLFNVKDHHKAIPEFVYIWHVTQALKSQHY